MLHDRPVMDMSPADRASSAADSGACEHPFAQRLGTCHAVLRRDARRLLRSSSDADDLVQETVLAALRSEHRFDASRGLLPWLRGLMRHVHADRRRAAALRTRRVNADPATIEAPAGGETDPVRQAAERELLESVRSVIGELPVAQARAVELHLLEGLGPREVAARLAVPRATLRVRLHRAIGVMRTRLAHVLGVTTLWALLTGRVSAQSRRGSSALAACAILLGACGLAAYASVGHGVDRDTAASGPVAANLPIEPLGDLPTLRRAPLAAVPARVQGHEIRVVDTAGAPVPSVGLRIVPRNGREALLHETSVVTDPSGHANPALEPADEYEVISDRGTRTALLGRAASTTVTIPVAANVVGEVRDEAGRPVPGAAIWLSEGDDGPHRGQEVCTTDARGRFRLVHVRPNQTLAARAEGHLRGWPVEVVPDSTGACEVALRLERGGEDLQGRVLAAGGEPCANAVVIVGESVHTTGLELTTGVVPWRAPGFFLRTDESGRFTVTGLEVGRHPLVVRAAGHVPGRTFVEVGGGSGREVVVALAAASVVHGTVRSVTGAPLAKALVVDDEHRSDREQPLAPTDASGNFAFECMDPGTHLIGAIAPGYGHRERVLGPAERTGAPVEFALAPVQRVHGVVLGPQGEPAMGVSVRVAQPRRDCLVRVAEEVTTDAEGRFELAVADQAEPLLLVRGPDEAFWFSTAGLTAREPDGSLRIVRAHHALPSASAKGTCVDGRGVAMAHARVRVRMAGHASDVEIAETDEHGAFESANLPSGDAEVYVESSDVRQPSFSAGRWTLTRGRLTAIHCIGPTDAGAARFRFSRADGLPLRDLVLGITDVATGRRFVRTSEAEDLQSLHPGTYELAVMGNEVRWVHAHRFTVEPFATTDVQLTLVPAVRLDIVARDLAREDAASSEGRIVIEDETGTLLGSWNVPLDAPSISLNAFAPVGTFRAWLSIGSGKRWSTAFTVADLAPRLEPIELHFVEDAPR